MAENYGKQEVFLRFLYKKKNLTVNLGNVDKPDLFGELFCAKKSILEK